jgi:hypothetical protein
VCCRPTAGRPESGPDSREYTGGETVFDRDRDYHPEIVDRFQINENRIQFVVSRTAKTALPFDLTCCTLDFPESGHWLLSVVFYSARGNALTGVNHCILRGAGNPCTKIGVFAHNSREGVAGHQVGRAGVTHESEGGGLSFLANPGLS